MERQGRKTFQITRSLKSKTLPAVVSVRGLQRVDVLANFGPPGTQQGTPEEEDEVGGIYTSMEEAACPEGRRRVNAMVVACTLWRRKHSQQWWGTHAQREKEEGKGGDIIHKAQEVNTK